MELYLRFDKDEPLKIMEIPEGQNQITFTLSKPTGNEPIKQTFDNLEFTDGKKTLKLFLK